MPRKFSLFLRGLALLSMLSACSDPYESPVLSLSQPVEMSFSCRKEVGATGWEAVPIEECSTDVQGIHLMGFVANGYTGDLGVLDLTYGDPIDTDPSIPGYTRLKLGTYLSDTVAQSDGNGVFALDSVDNQVIKLSPLTFEMTAEAGLDSEPLAMRLSADETSLLVLTLDTLQILSTTDLSKISSVELDGIPSDLAIVPGSDLLLVSYQTLQHVGLIDLTDGTVIKRIGLLHQCQDGLDNDGDSLIDFLDPDCQGMTDDDEAPDCAPAGDGTEAECPLPPSCSDGEDNDQDGLVDLADPGCIGALDDSEQEDLPPCSDGIDNDGDGKIDHPEDPDCASPDGDEWSGEVQEAWRSTCKDGIDNNGDGLTDGEDPHCKTDPWGRETSWYPCADGIDNDGDGLIDWPADPGCESAGAGSEASVLAPFSRIAVTPDGRFAYVSHMGLARILVLDLENLVRLDLQGGTGSADIGPNPMALKQHDLGIPWGSPVLDLEAVTGEDEDTGGAFVDIMVTAMDGTITSIRALTGEEPSHTLTILEQDPADSKTSKPKLYVDDEEVELGYTPRAEYPNMGDLSISTPDETTGMRDYYGIRFNEMVAWHTTENWRIIFEGIIPGTEELSGVLRNETRLDVPAADLCNLGVMPGDKLIIRFDADLDCGQYKGDSFEYMIAKAGQDWLELDPESPGVDAEGAEIPLPAYACFRGPLKLEIRVSDFLVTGSSSGFIHNVDAGPEGCFVPEDADPLLTGRARMAEIPDGKAISQCPINRDNRNIVLRTFSNPFFSFDLFPPCLQDEEGRISLISEVRRDLTWKFASYTGFEKEQIYLGGLPTVMEFIPAIERLMILDSGNRTMKSFNPSEMSVTGIFY